MKTLNVELGTRSYPIYIGRGLLGQDGLLGPYISGDQVMIVTNDVVAPLYMERLLASLLNYTVNTKILPDGEAHKNLATLESILDSLLAVPCDRQTTVIALGGGVVGDIAGFAAACYQRGVPFIQVPTTLLAQVDSSVGGKTAVNHARGKNMIGCFYQPLAVIADTDTLNTLPDRELKAGLAEVIKYGLIRDLEFFEWLEQHIDALLERDTSALSYAIERSCANKSEVVVADELERGERALLNLGHTFGHAIETGLGYGEWLHGEAVAAGTVMAAEVSRRLGHLAKSDVDRVVELYRHAGLPVSPPNQLNSDEYLRHMAVDKKVEDGVIRLILLRKIGQAYVSGDYPAHLLEDVLRHFSAAA